MRLLVTSLLLLFLSAPAVSSTVADAVLPLALYPHADVVEQDIQSPQDYRISLAAYKKVNNNWRTDKDLRVAGKLQIMTLELHTGQGLEEVFRYFKQQLEQFQGRELFECVGLDCGSSNAWANHHFLKKQLYGLDQYQYYSVVEVPWQDNKTVYAVIYGVTRGNKRSYIHMELLETEQKFSIASDPDAILKQLTRSGYFNLPIQKNTAGQYEVDDKHLKSLASLMRSKPSLTLAIVGHDYEGKDLAVRQQNSQTHANNIYERLLAVGGNKRRLSVHGVGSLSPRSQMETLVNDARWRVEVVLVK